MAKLMVGNAPCSWGTLEFDRGEGRADSVRPHVGRTRRRGLHGTELGDWGYMPTDPVALRAALENRGLVMLGAFVPVALKNVPRIRAASLRR